MSTKKPSVRMLATRCLEFHERLLAHAALGTKLDFSQMNAATQRGYETAYRTLRRWEAYDGEEITPFGRAIVEQIVISRPQGIAATMFANANTDKKG